MSDGLESNYIQEPLPSMDFNENEVRGTMPATGIGGSFVGKDQVIDYTFSRFAKDRWDHGMTKQMVSDFLGKYEDMRREYKPRDNPKINLGFRLIPSELHYDATDDDEVLVLHTAGQVRENHKPKFTGHSYIFLYRRDRDNTNLDVLKIADSSDRLISIKSFEIQKGHTEKSSRDWKIAFRKNRFRISGSKRRETYLENIKKAAKSVGYEIKANTEKGYIWEF